MSKQIGAMLGAAVAAVAILVAVLTLGVVETAQVLAVLAFVVALLAIGQSFRAVDNGDTPRYFFLLARPIAEWAPAEYRMLALLALGVFFGLSTVGFLGL